MPEIAIGRKEIMAVLHVADWRTVKNWRKSYSLPLRYLPNGKPMILASEVTTWMVEYSNLQKNQK